MKLKQILQGIEGIKTKGELELEIPSITNDSRNVEKGSMFIAVKGFETDGHEYIEQALKKGARVIMVQEGADIKKYLTVERNNNNNGARYKKSISNC